MGRVGPAEIVLRMGMRLCVGEVLTCGKSIRHGTKSGVGVVVLVKNIAGDVVVSMKRE